MNDTISGALNERLCKANFPRSSKYDPRWLMDNAMGPHVLWLAEWLSQGLEWNEVCEQSGQQNLAYLVGREAEMLRVDDGRTLGFTRVIAQRPKR